MTRRSTVILSLMLASTFFLASCFVHTEEKMDRTAKNSSIPSIDQTKSTKSTGYSSSYVGKDILCEPLVVFFCSDQSLTITQSLGNIPFNLHFSSNRLRNRDISVFRGVQSYWLGGWTLSVHHYYNLSNNILFFGDGSQLSYTSPPIKLISSPNEYAVASYDAKEVFIFDSIGRHIRTVDGLSGRILLEFVHDNAGRMVSVKTNNHVIISVSRDSTGIPTSLSNSFGDRVILNSNIDGFLSRIWRSTKDYANFKYTREGDVLESEEYGGKINSFMYDSRGRLSQHRDENGNIYVWNRTEMSDGYSISHSSKNRHISTYTVEFLSSGGSRRTTVTGDGLQTIEIFHQFGREVTLPDGSRFVLKFNPDPRWGNQATIVAETSLTMPSGLTATTTSKRDVILKNVSDPLSLKSFIESTGINGKISTTAYDAETRILTYVSPEKRTIIFKFDDDGRIIEANYAKNLPIFYTYDQGGLGTTISQGIGANVRTTKAQFSPDGNIMVTDPIKRVEVWNIDANNLIADEISKKLKKSSYFFNNYGNIVKVITPHSKIHSMGYSDDGTTFSYIPPSDGSLAKNMGFKYDSASLTARLTEPAGWNTSFHFDIHGRLIRFFDDNVTNDLIYSSITGNLEKISTSDGSEISFLYDGHLATTSRVYGTISGYISLAYNQDLQLSKQSINGMHDIEYQYDHDGFDIAVGDLQIKRERESGFIAESSIGVVKNNYSYNYFGELVKSTLSIQGVPTITAEYHHDLLGRIVKSQESDNGIYKETSFSYDDSDHLSEVRINNSISASYKYDDNGNRISEEKNSSKTFSTFDDRDAIVQYGDYFYTFSSIGSLESRVNNGLTTKYKYDNLGNLKSVNLSDGTKIEYLIDGLNRRVGKKVNGKITQGFMYYGGSRPVAELDESGRLVSRFVYSHDKYSPEYMIKNGKTYYIYSDHLGSPRKVIDVNDGSIIQRLEYDPFGQIVQDTNPGFQPFGFAGGLQDLDTHLIRFGARDYDPIIGRWTARDPLLFNGGDTNLYAYVKNDPINWTDPYGEQRHRFGPGHVDIPVKSGTPDDVLRSIERYVDQHMRFERDVSRTSREALSGHRKKLADALRGIYNQSRFNAHIPEIRRIVHPVLKSAGFSRVWDYMETFGGRSGSQSGKVLKIIPFNIVLSILLELMNPSVAHAHACERYSGVRFTSCMRMLYPNLDFLNPPPNKVQDAPRSKPSPTAQPNSCEASGREGLAGAIEKTFVKVCEELSKP